MSDFHSEEEFDAVQWTGDNWPDVCEFANGTFFPLEAMGDKRVEEHMPSAERLKSLLFGKSIVRAEVRDRLHPIR